MSNDAWRLPSWPGLFDNTTTKKEKEKKTCRGEMH